MDKIRFKKKIYLSESEVLDKNEPTFIQNFIKIGSLINVLERRKKNFEKYKNRIREFLWDKEELTSLTNQS